MKQRFPLGSFHGSGLAWLLPMIEQSHTEIDEIRRAQGKPQWNWAERREAIVSDERCQMCKEAGFTDVLAHYKGVAKGASATGQAIPPLCFDHKNGRVPKFIVDKLGPGTGKMGRHPIFQWCGSCWTEGDRNVAVTRIDGLPLCNLCAGSVGADRELLAEVKAAWDAMPDFDEGPAAQKAFSNVVKAASTTPSPAKAAYKVFDAHAAKFDGNAHQSSVTLPRKAVVNRSEERCACGKSLGHVGRCSGNAAKPDPAETNPSPRTMPAPTNGTSELLDGLKIQFMKTSDYVSQFGSFRSKGMNSRTQELWERLVKLQVGDCIVVDVPKDVEPFKMRARLCNTVQRLVRQNKPNFRISLGANNIRRHVVIAKESTDK